MGTLVLGLGLGACSGGEGDDGEPTGEQFSFFVTSMAGLLELAADAQGFGGDLSSNGQRGVLGAATLRPCRSNQRPPAMGAGPGCASNRSCRDNHDVLTGGYGGFYRFASTP